MRSTAVKNAEVVDILTKARDRIAPEGRWTRNAPARDEAGNPVPAFSPLAVCWCMTGTVLATTDGEYTLALARAIIQLHDALGCSSRLSYWNDRFYRKQEQVIAVFDKAIQTLKDVSDEKN